MSSPREQALVELVSADGAAIGSATVADAHTAPGALHRAFSVLLFDGDGRTLLQQRAATKTRFPLRWANACCGHPAPGEPVTVAAARRLDEELGITGVDLAEVGVYAYEATDPVTGRIEKEYDHVVVGQFAAGRPMRVDPEEVADTTWVPAAALTADSRDYAPWLHGVLGVALSVIVQPDRP